MQTQTVGFEPTHRQCRLLTDQQFATLPIRFMSACASSCVGMFYSHHIITIQPRWKVGNPHKHFLFSEEHLLVNLLFGRYPTSGYPHSEMWRCITQTPNLCSRPVKISLQKGENTETQHLPVLSWQTTRQQCKESNLVKFQQSLLVKMIYNEIKSCKLY